MGIDTRSRASGLTGYVIRSATRQDLEVVSGLERACYADPWSASSFAALPDNPQVCFRVAVSENATEIVGYAVAWYVMDQGELANLAVVPGHRRKGIAKSLLDAILHDAFDRDIAELFLEVRESNVAARHLYSTHQFQEVGRRRGYYRSPVEDALVLRRALRN